MKPDPPFQRAWNQAGQGYGSLHVAIKRAMLVKSTRYNTESFSLPPPFAHRTKSQYFCKYNPEPQKHE